MIKNIHHGDEFPVNWNAIEKEIGLGLNDTDYEYHSLLVKILQEGIWKQNRTGVKTLSIFGPQVEFHDVANKFPLLTTKKVHLKSVIGELLWFLEGSTDKNVLKNKYGVSIWDEWNAPHPKFDGDMGPIYGNQWVNWEYIDPTLIDEAPKDRDGLFRIKDIKRSINQIKNIIDTLKKNPDDRRMIVSAWHVEEISKMALPPCHWSYQFYSVLKPEDEQRTLHIIENQRSVDTFLGLPFNIASYALLLMMVAQQTNHKPGNLIMNLGDTHIYENHLEFIYQQLERDSKREEPIMIIDKAADLFNYSPSLFHLENYNAHPNFKDVPIAV